MVAGLETDEDGGANVFRLTKRNQASDLRGEPRISLKADPHSSAQILTNSVVRESSAPLARGGCGSKLH
jgi:hypothetical protein